MGLNTEASDVLQTRAENGLQAARQFLASKKYYFSELKPSDLPERPGVYAIFHTDTGETLYVGRTKNLRQRLYNNHLHGPITNARFKKYLTEDPNEPEAKDFAAAKDYLKKHCCLQFVIEDDTLLRGRLEGLLNYLFHVRYLYEEH